MPTTKKPANRSASTDTLIRQLKRIRNRAYDVGSDAQLAIKAIEALDDTRHAGLDVKAITKSADLVHKGISYAGDHVDRLAWAIPKTPLTVVDPTTGKEA